MCVCVCVCARARELRACACRKDVLNRCLEFGHIPSDRPYSQQDIQYSNRKAENEDDLIQFIIEMEEHSRLKGRDVVFDH